MKVPLRITVPASVVAQVRMLIGAVFLAFVSPAPSISAPADLYVSEPTNGIIFKFAPEGTKSTFASGLDFPRGLVFDRASNLFVGIGSQPGSIVKFSPSGEMTVFASELSLPGGLAFDGAGNLYVTESFGDAGQISKFTPSGTKSSFGSYDGFESGSPYGLAFSPLGDLFATIPSNPFNFDGGIIWFSPDGTGHTFSISSGPGLAFDTAGNLYVTHADEILKFTPRPEVSQSVFVSGFTAAINLAFDSAGNLFVVDGDSIQKVNADGTKSVFASGVSAAFLAFEPVREKLRNISARGLVGTGDDALIGGFIVGGNALATNAVLVRAIGPSLSQAGVSNPLADPTLELHNSSGAVIASNDDWQDTQEEQITATGVPPTDPNESAIYAILPAGNYAAVVRGGVIPPAPP